jgi:hypothetical protein
MNGAVEGDRGSRGDAIGICQGSYKDGGKDAGGEPMTGRSRDRQSLGYRQIRSMPSHPSACEERPGNPRVGLGLGAMVGDEGGVMQNTSCCAYSLVYTNRSGGWKRGVKDPGLYLELGTLSLYRSMSLSCWGF